MTGEDAREIWRRRLDFLLVEEAKAVEPAAKFKIQEDIAEARNRLSELGEPNAPTSEPLGDDAGIPPDPLLPRWTEELKTYGEGFAGRQAELAALDQAWASGRTRVFTLHAEGGAGKTRVLVKWLNAMRDHQWRGAGGVFVHSFYSQGSDERRNASSEVFFGKALAYFGYRGEPVTDANEKGRKLGELIVTRQGLLVLDGLEPLQHPPGFNQGRVKDPAIERLLLSLSIATGAVAAPALCIVTSRQPVVELQPREGKAVVQRHLERLDPAAGLELLRQLEVRGPDNELAEAVEDFGGHAYSLMLLGSYLRDATDDREIRRRHDIPLLEEDKEHGLHARHMFGAYIRHLGEDSAEVAVLRLLGFFDRAAERELLDVLRAPQGVIYEPSEEAKQAQPMRQPAQPTPMPRDGSLEAPGSEPKRIDDAMPSVTAPLIGLSPAVWQRVLRRLQDLRLIAFGPGRSVIDAHPLLREDFADRLRRDFPEAWRSGHRLLYEHLCAATEHRPDTLEGLQPLYQAVTHGCKAGLYEQACADVYRDRILRGTGSGGFYSSKKLGAVGADLGAVTCLFEHPWDRPSPQLSAFDRAWVLSDAAFSLRALGRLTEALVPMRAGLEMAVEQDNWKPAAIRAGNLSELELTLGDLRAAVADTGQAVDLADRSRDDFEPMKQRVKRADALHQAGRPEEARRLFAEAEAMQTEQQPAYPRLYSVRGFQYCDLPLSPAEGAAWRFALDPGARVPDRQSLEKACDQVAERAAQTLKWAKRNKAALLTVALDHLTLARTALYRALLTAERAERAFDLDADDSAIHIAQSAIDHLSAAVDGLRKAGTMDHLPRGLLTRAWHRHLSADPAGAASDLDEAWDIAERGHMLLYQADILLTRARLFGTRNGTAGYPWESPQADLAEARRLIEKHGYHRRAQELADAEAALGVDPEPE